LALGAISAWFGEPKLAGHPSATSNIAKTVDLGDPAITVPVLGAWEALIGLCFLFKGTARAGCRRSRGSTCSRFWRCSARHW
jgi:HAMP domain-containing protein